MSTFNIETFAAGCKQAMHQAGDQNADRMAAARTFLEKMMQENDPQEIIEVLDAAIPPGADIGEMLVHTSAELTMLYGRIPPRFQSGIHNHTVFACIGQLTGAEANTFYKKSEDGNGLNVIATKTITPGEVLTMPADAIHHIENPTDNSSSALHLYGGDFRAVMDERSLWSYENNEETPFSFEGLLKESVAGMKMNDNQIGLDAIVEAIPATKNMI
jgi:predicted metal-dependent enzyme (double-stranded beta helix superfamily)